MLVDRPAGVDKFVSGCCRLALVLAKGPTPSPRLPLVGDPIPALATAYLWTGKAESMS